MIESPKSKFVQTGTNPYETHVEDHRQQPVHNNLNLKYKIIDLYWLQHPNLHTDIKSIHERCAHIAVISHNISFGNLKVTFYHTKKDSFINNVIFMKNLVRKATCTIYSPALAEIQFTKESQGEVIYSYDQLVTSDTNQDWQKNLPITILQRFDDKDTIRLIITKLPNSKDQYYYDFIGWQKQAFLKAAEFCQTIGPQLNGFNILLQSSVQSSDLNNIDEEIDDFVL